MSNCLRICIAKRSLLFAPEISGVQLVATILESPNWASATFLDPATPLELLSCFTQGYLRAGAVLNLNRVFLETSNSCAVGSRHEIACALGWVATKVPLRSQPSISRSESKSKPGVGYLRVSRHPSRTAAPFTEGSLGAGAVLGLTRIFLETGNRCAVGSRHEVACAFGRVATKVPPRPGAAR